VREGCWIKCVNLCFILSCYPKKFLDHRTFLTLPFSVLLLITLQPTSVSTRKHVLEVVRRVGCTLQIIETQGTIVYRRSGTTRGRGLWGERRERRIRR
jgi:hypothetical protein